MSSKILYKKALKFYIGMDRADVKKVILSNIKPLHEAILNSSKIITRYKGIYECSIVEIQNEKYILIRITPGNVIVDMLKVLTFFCDIIFFIGIAASLNSIHSIGSIVTPKFFQKSGCLTIKNSFRDTEGTIFQADGMLYTKRFYKKLKKNGIDFVDMESYYLALYCCRYGVRFKFIAQISDNPFSKSIFDYKEDVVINVEEILERLSE